VLESIANKDFTFNDFSLDDFTDTRFERCVFNGASFDEVAFVNCEFIECELWWVHARGATFDCVVFSDCKGRIILRETNWEGRTKSRGGDLRVNHDDEPPIFVDI